MRLSCRRWSPSSSCRQCRRTMRQRGRHVTRLERRPSEALQDPYIRLLSLVALEPRGPVPRDQPAAPRLPSLGRMSPRLEEAHLCDHIKRARPSRARSPENDAAGRRGQLVKVAVQRRVGQEARRRLVRRLQQRQRVRRCPCGRTACIRRRTSAARQWAARMGYAQMDAPCSL
jgi:hypothetical protein